VLLTAVFVVGCGGNAIAKASFSSSSSGSPIVSAMNGYAASQLPRNQFDQQLAAMQANGVRVVRADAPWANIEPLPPGPAGPTYQFAQTDALVSALATHHLTWEPLIDFSVWWAKTCPGMCAPSSDATYATFAQTIAARYGVHGSFWAQNPQLPYYPAQIFEIWNEENAALFWITPARYASLYSAARAAIHAVDPGASVIVGGLADDSKAYTVAQDYPSWYVTQMFVADPGLRGNVDGFGLHPYGTTAVDVEKWVAHFRQTLTVLGEGAAPIDITEIGWTTGDAARENWRAWMMFNVAFTLSHSNCGIRLLAPYDWIDPLILHESGDFGLVDQSGVDTSLRPAGTGWFHGLAVAPSKPQTPLCGSAQVPAKSLSDVHVRSVRGVSRSRPRRHHR
jgi:hypothetical protein